MSPNPNGVKDFRIGADMKKIIFVSKLKIRVGCHGHQGGPRPKIFCMVNPTNELVNPPRFDQIL